MKPSGDKLEQQTGFNLVQGLELTSGRSKRSKGLVKNLHLKKIFEPDYGSNS
jgi:hypothetical protein